MRVTIKKFTIAFGMEVITMHNKYLLSIKEASNLFGIGQHRLREIVQNDYECRYHLMIGRVIRIKRESFEEFISKVEQI
jgi:excisionase family DNA binding protein